MKVNYNLKGNTSPCKIDNLKSIFHSKHVKACQKEVISRSEKKYQHMKGEQYNW